MENILLQRPMTPAMIVITDFGLARREPIRPRRMNTICGTFPFFAPEMILMIPKKKRSLNPGYGKEVDIWAIGIIAYAVMSGELPFFDETDEEDADILKRILREAIFFSTTWRKSQLGNYTQNRIDISYGLCEEAFREKCVYSSECVSSAASLFYRLQ